MGTAMKSQVLFFKHVTRAKFLSLTTTEISNQIMIYYGGSPVHFRMFSNIPGLYPLDSIAHALLPIGTTRNVHKHCQMSGEGPGIAMVGLQLAYCFAL